MKYTDYLAQQAQEPQETQETQEEPQAQANQLDAIRAQLDAGKYYSLLAEARAAIEAEAEPSALAARLTAAIFGTDSPEAGTVTEAIEKARRPGGYDYAIAMAAQRKGLYKKQLKQLAELQKELAEQAQQADAEEWKLRAEASDTGRANWDLLAVMDFSRQLDADPGAILSQARALYEKHNGNRPAMGLLYGIITEWQGRDLTGPGLDLVQQQEMQELKAKLAAAAGQ